MSKNPQEMGTAVAEAVAGVGVAIAAIVLAIKQQPGFDSAAFDEKIEKLLKQPELSSITRSTLEATLDRTY
ncbi:hypothetical protein [Pseudomonas fragi]|uniref:hypothetical protein n=1 Tax=Pseudomonas fragi TaxID=296 RepID=UPI00147476C9|nr:hypothetical protein [Pseudomonas fragi]NNB15948.1 hypothetical protein [Pseudomonas fragi]NNB18458.1 hypothetical protein [Pseudomonas fragi]